MDNAGRYFQPLWVKVSQIFQSFKTVVTKDGLRVWKIFGRDDL